MTREYAPRDGAGALCPQDDRAAVLAALEYVSHVCIFSGESVESLVAALAPDVLVKGGDTPAAIVGREHVEARGGQVRACRCGQTFPPPN